MQPTLKDHCKEAYKLLESKEIKGIMISKYLDKANHAFKTIELRTNISVEKWVIDADKSGLYQYILEGDSLVKQSDSYEVRLYRDGVYNRTFIMDYKCDDLNK